MFTKLKRVTALLLVAIMLLGTASIATGCGDTWGKTFEVNGWELFRYTKSRRVNILGAMSESLVVDGVLNIPDKIGKYKIYGFGRYERLFYGGYEYYFGIKSDIEVEHIVLAANLNVSILFGKAIMHDFPSKPRKGLRYVEYLSNTFEKITYFGNVKHITYIIPDGSTQNFLNKIESDGSLIELFTFIEKSKFLEEKNNV